MNWYIVSFCYCWNVRVLFVELVRVCNLNYVSKLNCFVVSAVYCYLVSILMCWNLYNWSFSRLELIKGLYVVYWSFVICVNNCLVFCSVLIEKGIKCNWMLYLILLCWEFYNELVVWLVVLFSVRVLGIYSVLNSFNVVGRWFVILVLILLVLVSRVSMIIVDR